MPGTLSITTCLCCFFAAWSEPLPELASCEEVDATHLDSQVEFLQREMSIEQASDTVGRLAVDSHHASTPLRGDVDHQDTLSLFCWAVVTPTEPTVDLAHKQMMGCDGNLMLSTFSDPTRNIVKLYDDMTLGTPYTDELGHSWANLTHMFRDAWRYIAKTTEGQQFQWYVKIDADTFFRPQMLTAFLRTFDFNPTDVIGVGALGEFMQGGCEVVSQGAVHSPKRFYDLDMQEASDEDPSMVCEDIWLPWALRSIGGSIVSLNGNKPCFKWYLNEYAPDSAAGRLLYDEVNIPRSFDEVIYGVHETSGNHTVRADIFRKDTYIDGGHFEGNQHDPHFVKQTCLSKDVVAIHPVKEFDVYRQLVERDEESRIISF